MELTSNVWRVYPDDAPGSIGRTSPAVSEIHAHRIVWTPDAASVAGDIVDIRDRNGWTIFFHSAVNGETFFEKEYASPLQGPLDLGALDSGVVEVFLA